MKNSAARQIHPDLRERVEELRPWFHNMELDGVWAAPDHPLGNYPRDKFDGFAQILPEDMSSLTVLDIGCNGGFYSMEMCRRGARRVVAIDTDDRYLAQARLAAEIEGYDIEFHNMSVYEVERLNERFDLVIFMGVFYHLRHPLLALDLIREHVMGKQMLFQSLQRGWDTLPALAEDYPIQNWEIFDKPDFPTLFFIEERYAQDPTNWFIPNRAGMEAMLRSSGFAIEQHPEREVYLCSAAERHYAAEAPLRILSA